MKFLCFVLTLLILGIHLTLCDDSSIKVDRVLRQATEEPKAPPPAAATGGKQSWKELKKKYNLADPVSEDYPIIFNIILFVAVSLILAVIAIAVSISSMDPGRDSLIYRVTSGQKAKKGQLVHRSSVIRCLTFCNYRVVSGS